MVGIAIRYGQALGLHLRADAVNINESEKEMRVRIWYAIHSLEQILAVITGRPIAIQERDCTVPLPMPMESEMIPPEFSTPQGVELSESPLDTQGSTRSPTLPPYAYMKPSLSANRHRGTFLPPAVLYFSEHGRVSQITVDALSSLYYPETMKMSWLDVQGKIADLSKALTQWRAELPHILDFGKRQRDQDFVSQVIYYDSVI